MTYTENDVGGLVDIIGVDLEGAYRTALTSLFRSTRPGVMIAMVGQYVDVVCDHFAIRDVYYAEDACGAYRKEYVVDHIRSGMRMANASDMGCGRSGIEGKMKLAISSGVDFSVKEPVIDASQGKYLHDLKWGETNVAFSEWSEP